MNAVDHIQDGTGRL